MDIIGLPVLLACATVIFLALYYYFTKNFDFWEKRHVAGPKPILFFGNSKDIFLGKVHLADYLKQLYDAYPLEPLIGIFVNSSPALVVKDPEFIKEVLVKSFSSFSDRGVRIHADIDPLSQHLVHLEPKRWKPMRKRLTPVFSSGRIKEMFYLIVECANHFSRYMEKLIVENDVVECRELTAKFTTDVITVCAFGLDVNALSDEDSVFRKVGRKVFDTGLRNTLRHTVRKLPYWMAKLMQPIVKNQNMIRFFVNTIEETMEFRQKTGVRRNDFVDLLMDIKNRPKEIGEEELTGSLLTAQAYVFFAAGFETSSATISNALYEMSLNTHIQDKLREEIKTTIDLNSENISYEKISELKYLDKVIKESLRKYPPGETLRRLAVNDYTFLNTKISIPKGTSILIPAYAIHYDSNIYPEPDKFNPERFNEDLDKARPSMSYLAFGEGPRNCIGERFGLYQTKVGLLTLIYHFKFEICEKTCLSYEKQIGPMILTPKGGLYLRIRKLEED